MVELDHIVICAKTLHEGAEYVSDMIGVVPETGGQHHFMGTHNLLIALGNGTYLEVIAIDPGLPDPKQPRWFGLDTFEGPPRLTNWVCRTDDLAKTVAAAPDGMRSIIDAARGELRWQMAISGDGQYPFDGAFPGLISWQSPSHPCDYLKPASAILQRFEISHPEAPALSTAIEKVGLSHDVTRASDCKLTAFVSISGRDVVLA